MKGIHYKPMLEFEQLSLGQRQDGRNPGAILYDTENREACGGQRKQN